MAVTRRGPGWTPAEAVHKEQSISLARAPRAACLDGPRSAGRLDEGHLGVGARADLIVVSADLLRDPPEPDDLASIRPLAALLDGSVIHRDGAFDT